MQLQTFGGLRGFVPRACSRLPPSEWVDWEMPDPRENELEKVQRAIENVVAISPSEGSK